MRPATRETALLIAEPIPLCAGLIDPRIAAVVFYGGIDELLTGWVLGQNPGTEADVAAAEQTLVDKIGRAHV